MYRLQDSTATSSEFPETLQEALNQGVLKRLPLTFLPFVNEQLHQWEFLFPNERRSVERLLIYVARLSQQGSVALFRDVVDLENKMGVHHWQFSTSEQTILNSSQLAKSPYFQQWRRAVQAVFDAADRDAQNTTSSVKDANRLILVDIPPALPLTAATIWQRWQGLGRTINLDLETTTRRQGALELLLAGRASPGGGSDGLLSAARARPNATPADTWIIDAGKDIVEPLVNHATGTVLLSYARLDPYRENFSHEMNTMRKDLADADAVFDRLRQVDVSKWCPPEVGSDPAVREFVRSVFLSGNGAVIFGNSFVEWASSEAFRRARPSFLAARFGVRSRPKPFTGVAVFENPDQVNPLPAVDDFEGSAIDAQMLALYVWLAAARFEEYQRSTVCVCLAESISQAYILAPPEFTLSDAAEPVSLNRLNGALHDWITQT
jgi:hypothetical protein